MQLEYYVCSDDACCFAPISGHSSPFAPSLNLRAIVKDNEPWFVAKDVCDALSILNTTDALNKNIDQEDRARLKLGGRETNVVNESGLYSLILKSRKPYSTFSYEYPFSYKQPLKASSRLLPFASLFIVTGG